MENGKVHVKLSLNLKKSNNKQNIGATETTVMNYRKTDFISSKRGNAKMKDMKDVFSMHNVSKQQEFKLPIDDGKMNVSPLSPSPIRRRPQTTASPTRPSVNKGIRGRGGMGRAAIYNYSKNSQQRPTTVNYLGNNSRSLMYNKNSSNSRRKKSHQPTPTNLYDQSGRIIQKSNSNNLYPKTFNNLNVAIEGAR